MFFLEDKLEEIPQNFPYLNSLSLGLVDLELDDMEWMTLSDRTMCARERTNRILNTRAGFEQAGIK